MTDYFALLEQPRRPWLDLEELKQAFHSQSLLNHPDVQGSAASETEAGFEQINEAHQALKDPKRRLQHLLALENYSAPSGGTIPKELEDLFPEVAFITQEAERVRQQALAVTNALSRSLLRAELLGAQNGIVAILEKLLSLQREAEGELQQLSHSWTESGSDRFEQLHGLYVRFSYVTRWIAELDEKQTQLSTF